MAYGVHEERYPLPIAAVDTHRPRPSKKGKESKAPSVPDNTSNGATGGASGVHGGANVARDYFGDSKMYAARPEMVAQALEGAQAGNNLEPKVVQQS